MTLFVEQKERELELSVAGTLVDAPLLEGLERILDKPVGSRVLDAKAIALRSIFTINLLQSRIHLAGELLSLCLGGAPVAELPVEIVG